jgi:hypothetical protein
MIIKIVAFFGLTYNPLSKCEGLVSNLHFSIPHSHPLYPSSRSTPIRDSGDKSVVTLDPMKGIITSYLASSQGQEMIRNYLSSPEGQKAICEFVTTPKGREAMKQVLPGILGCMSLPRDLQSEVTRTLKEIP